MPVTCVPSPLTRLSNYQAGYGDAQTLATWQVTSLPSSIPLLRPFWCILICSWCTSKRISLNAFKPHAGPAEIRGAWMTLSHFLLPSHLSLPSACVCGCWTHQRPNWSMLWQIEEDAKNAAVINGDKPQRFDKQVLANFYPMCRLTAEKVDGGMRHFQRLRTHSKFIQKMSSSHRQNDDDHLHLSWWSRTWWSFAGFKNHHTQIRRWATVAICECLVPLAIGGGNRPLRPGVVHDGLPW